MITLETNFLFFFFNFEGSEFSGSEVGVFMTPQNIG